MRFLLVPTCLLLAVVPACVCRGSGSGSSGGVNQGSAEPSAQASASVSAPPPDPRLTARPPRLGGFVGLVARSARESAATPEQKVTILGIEQTLHDAEPPFAPLKDYQEHLAAAIRAGQVVVATFQPDYVAIDNVETAREDKQAEALNSLHAALDVPSRHAVVALARSRLVATFHTRPELSIDAGAGDSGDPPWLKHRVARISGDLGLDAPEKVKLAQILARQSLPPHATDAKKEAMKKHAEELLDAFDQDTFDAKKLDLSGEGGHKPAHEALEHEAVLIGQVLPILSAEQREKLATSKSRRVGRWVEDAVPWSPFEEIDLVPGQPRLR